MNKFNKGHAIITFIIAIYLGLLSSVFCGIFNTYTPITALVTGDIFGVWQTSTGGFKNITWGNVVTQMFSNPFDISLAENYVIVGDSAGLAKSVRVIGEIQLGIPDVCGSATTRDTTSANATYGHCLFSGTVTTNNFIEWYIVVPSDWDTAVDPTAEFVFSLNGTENAKEHYHASVCTALQSAARNCTVGTPIPFQHAADANGVAGDIEYIANVTLTGWKSIAIPGQMLKIQIERQGDDGTNDDSTIASYDYGFVIHYLTKPGS